MKVLILTMFLSLNALAADNCIYDDKGRFIENTGFYFKPFFSTYKDKVDYLSDGGIVYTGSVEIAWFSIINYKFVYTAGKEYIQHYFNGKLVSDDRYHKGVIFSNALAAEAVACKGLDLNK